MLFASAEHLFVGGDDMLVLHTTFIHELFVSSIVSLHTTILTRLCLCIAYYQIRCWEKLPGKSARLLTGLEGHTEAVTSCVFARAFALLASASAAGDVLVHGVQRGGVCQRVCEGEGSGVNRLSLRPKEAAHLLG